MRRETSPGETRQRSTFAKLNKRKKKRSLSRALEKGRKRRESGCENALCIALCDSATRKRSALRYSRNVCGNIRVKRMTRGKCFFFFPLLAPGRTCTAVGGFRLLCLRYKTYRFSCLVFIFSFFFFFYRDDREFSRDRIINARACTW